MNDNKLHDILSKYSDVEKALFLNNESNEDNSNKLVLFGKIKDDIFSEIKNSEELEEYITERYSDLKDRKTKKHVKKHGQILYEKEEYQFANYCKCTYTQKI